MRTRRSAIKILGSPAAAKAEIMKAMKSGRTLYEAEFKNKPGKNQAVLVSADGTEVKD